MTSLFSAIEPGKVVAEGADVIDQVVGPLLEAHQDAGLVVDGGAVHQEGQGEQGLAASRGARDQSGTTLRQPAESDLVQADNACRSLTEVLGRGLTLDCHSCRPPLA